MKNKVWNKYNTIELIMGFINICGVIVFLTFFITGLFLTNKGFYYAVYDKSCIDCTKEELDVLFQAFTSYFSYSIKELPSHMLLDEQALLHMQDVYSLYKGLTILGILSIPTICGSLICLIFNDNKISKKTRNRIFLFIDIFLVSMFALFFLVCFILMPQVQASEWILYTSQDSSYFSCMFWIIHKILFPGAKFYRAVFPASSFITSVYNAWFYIIIFLVVLFAFIIFEVSKWILLLKKEDSNETKN